MARTPLLALAVTPWHALGVDVHVELAGDSIDVERSTIAVVPHGTFPRLSPESFPLAVKRGIRVVEIPEAYRIWDHVRATLAVMRFNGTSTVPPCDVLIPRAPADVLVHLCAAWPPHRLAGARFLIMDEGIGSYLYRVIDRRGWFSTRPPLTHVRRRLLHECWRIARRWTDSVPTETRDAFEFAEPGSHRLRLTRDIGRTYVRLLRDRVVTLAAHPARPDAPRAIVLTEPNIAYGLYPKEADPRVFRSVVGHVADCGFGVYVKAHPDEDADVLRGYLRGTPHETAATFLDPGIAAERLLAGLSPHDVVVGVTSGALLSARLLFELRTFTAAPFVLRDPDVPAAFHRRVAEVRLLTDAVGVADLGELSRVS